MRPNYKHYILLLIGIGTVVISGLGYWYVYTSIINNAQRNSMVIKEIERNKENKKNEEDLLEMGKATEGYRTKLSTYILSEDEIIDFITSIENIEKSTQSEVIISSISKNDVQDHIRLHVDIKGGWVNINKSLIMLENLPYSITIDYANFTQNSGKWTLSINLSALYAK